MEIRPSSHVEHVMRLSELYKRIKAGDHISLNDYLMNPPHVSKVIPANPGQDVFITMLFVLYSSPDSMKKWTRKCNVWLSHFKINYKMMLKAVTLL